MPTGLRPTFTERLADLGIELPARLLGIDAPVLQRSGSTAMTGTWTLPAGAVALFGALVLIGLELVRPRVARRRHLATELGVKQRETARTRVAALGTQATALAERALENYDQ